MYGERATELVRDLRRFDTLPAYNVRVLCGRAVLTAGQEAVVREVGKEITALFAENAKTLKCAPRSRTVPWSRRGARAL